MSAAKPAFVVSGAFNVNVAKGIARCTRCGVAVAIDDAPAGLAFVRDHRCASPKQAELPTPPKAGADHG